MKQKWIGVLSILPMLAACDTSIKLSSTALSRQQLDTITQNINSLYPETDTDLKQNIANLAVKSIENMVFVEGGTFTMGDFRMPCINEDLNRPVWTSEASCYSQVEIVSRVADIQHEVTLSAYSLSKYEAELLDYDIYLQLIGRPFEQFEYDGQYLVRDSSDYKTFLTHFMKKPAREVSWTDAKNYCQWLGKLTALPVDLPTEAQWEYAARSRGQKLYHATDNGFIQYKRGHYYNEELNRYEKFTAKNANIDVGLAPVGTYKNNPLGIYDMSNNAAEWVNDWYAKDYYSVSPQIDPTGPISGATKVVRGGQGMVTAARTSESLNRKGLPFRTGFRCSVQSHNLPH